MSFFAPFRGRGLALISLLLVQLLVGASLGAIGTVAVARPLRTHPDGVWAIFAEGGRIALDLYRNHGESIDLAVLVMLVGLLLWALVWLVLGGTLPTLFSPRAPTLREAVAHSIRRAPTLLGLVGLYLLGLGIIAAVGVKGEFWIARKTAHAGNLRDQQLLELAMSVPPLLLAWALSVWHDVARTRAFLRGIRASQAGVEAFSDVLHSPWRYLSSAAGYALLGQLAVGVAALAAMALEHNRAAWAVGALFVTQQLALAWRFACRARWFAWLAEAP